MNVAPWRRANGKPTGELLLASVPLDRNLNAEQRKNITTVYRLLDPLHPEKARVIAELPGTGWFGGSFNRAGTQIALTRYVSANESELWLLDVQSGQRSKLLPADDKTRASHPAAALAATARASFWSVIAMASFAS